MPQNKCIAVVASLYPSGKALYRGGFVHTRVAEYIKKGEKVKVFVPAREESEYEFEGVRVRRAPVQRIVHFLEKCDVVMLHLVHLSLTPELDGAVVYRYLLRESVPTVFFVHGYEAQRAVVSLRSEFSLARLRSSLGLLYHDLFYIPKMRRIILRFLETHPAVRFVTVSNWMLEEVKRSIGIDLRPKAVVIPNGINTSRFRFEYRWQDRHRFLSLRPLVLGGKYAVDLAVKTMPYLPKEVVLDLYGKGRDAAKIRRIIERQALQGRLNLVETFVPNAELPKLFAGHGGYYAVTRMDAQGVSMCEAMASGLAVVSFRTTGIPEFVKHGETGLLAKPYDVKEAAGRIETLVTDKNLYTRLVENARRFIESIDISITAAKELEVVESLI